MRKLTIALAALLAAGALLAAPAAGKGKAEDAWVAQCKGFSVFGISMGMTPAQVRNVFLKAPRTTLLPWSETTAYGSQFRYDIDTTIGPLSTPLHKLLDIGFAPILTNAPKRAQMRVWFDNPYGRTYPMQESHDPGDQSLEVLPYIEHVARFHDIVVYTNTTVLAKPILRAKERATVRVFFNRQSRAVAIEVKLRNMRDEDKDAALKILRDKYSWDNSNSDYDFYNMECREAPQIKMQSAWRSNITSEDIKKGAPQNSRRWQAENFYYHEEAYLKALQDKALKDPLENLL